MTGQHLIVSALSSLRGLSFALLGRFFSPLAQSLTAFFALFLFLLSLILLYGRSETKTEEEWSGVED